MSDSLRNGLSGDDYLSAEQVHELGGDPDDLRRLGVEPLVGLDGQDCWPASAVWEWLNGREGGGR